MLDNPDPRPRRFWRAGARASALPTLPAPEEQKIRRIAKEHSKVRVDTVEVVTLRFGDPRIWNPLDWTNLLHRRLRADTMQHRAVLSHEQVRRPFPRSQEPIDRSRRGVVSYR